MKLPVPKINFFSIFFSVCVGGSHIKNLKLKLLSTVSDNFRKQIGNDQMGIGMIEGMTLLTKWKGKTC